MTERYPDASVADARIGGEVFFFSKADSLPDDVQIIGEFVLKEDMKTRWDPNKKRIIEFAKNNNANGVIIDQLGWSLKGHGFYVKGRVFNLPQIALEKAYLINNLESDCQISLYRDEGEPPLGAGTKASVRIDDWNFNDFKNRTYGIIETDDCSKVNITVNGKDHRFENNDNSKRYFKLSKNVGGYSGTAGMGISVGGFVLQEVNDPLLGKLITEQYLKTNPTVD